MQLVHHSLFAGLFIYDIYPISPSNEACVSLLFLQKTESSVAKFSTSCLPDLQALISAIFGCEANSKTWSVRIPSYLAPASKKAQHPMCVTYHKLRDLVCRDSIASGSSLYEGIASHVHNVSLYILFSTSCVPDLQALIFAIFGCEANSKT